LNSRERREGATSEGGSYWDDEFLVFAAFFEPVFCHGFGAYI